MGFVINLSTAGFRDPMNYYGYWSGITYKHDGEVFPVCDSRVEDRTKRYTSRKRAENAAEKIAYRCEYVLSYKVVDETEVI